VAAISSAKGEAQRILGEQSGPGLGLICLRARYLDPATGRFRTMDPHQGVLSQPLTLRDYMYANGSPVDLADPSGEISLMTLSLTIALLAIIISVAVHDLAGLATSGVGVGGTPPRGGPLQQVKDFQAEQQFIVDLTAASVDRWVAIGSVGVGSINNICSNVGYGEGCVAWQAWIIQWYTAEKAARAPKWDRVIVRKARSDFLFFEHHFAVLQVGARERLALDPWRNPNSPIYTEFWYPGSIKLE